MNPYIRETNYGNLMLNSTEARKSAESFKYNQEDRLIRAEEMAYAKGMDNENILIAEEERAYQREQMGRAFQIDQEERAYQREQMEEERAYQREKDEMMMSGTQQPSNMYGTTGGTPLPRANIGMVVSGDSLKFTKSPKIVRKPTWDAHASDADKLRAATPKMNYMPTYEERREEAYQAKSRKEGTALIKMAEGLSNRGQEEALSRLESANINKKELDIATNKAKAAKGFMNGVTKKEYGSFKTWLDENEMLPKMLTPTVAEAENMSELELQQKLSKIGGYEVTNKEINDSKKTKLARETFQLKQEAQQNKRHEQTLKRLEKKSDGDISFLSPKEQQSYYELEDKLNTSHQRLGGKMYLTPYRQEQIQAQYGNDQPMSRQQMQSVLNKKNAEMVKIDRYAMLNKANQDIINKIIERDGKTDVQVRRALAENGIKFEQSRKDFIKDLILSGTESGFSIPRARKNAFEAYLEKLNQSRGM